MDDTGTTNPEQDRKRDRIGGITAQLDDLRKKAPSAEGDAKSEIERQIRNLEAERDSLARDVQGLENSGKQIGGDLRH